jgi:hypothetical protein
MSCLQSFTLFSSGDETISDPQLNYWGVLNSNTWNIDNLSTSNSSFFIQGFKNINLYGIDMIGYVSGGNTDARSGLVKDWGFTLLVDGQVPEISGSITTSPNRYALTKSYPSIQTITLSKMKPNISFVDPITSVQDITINGLFANGLNIQTLGLIRLKWQIQFIFYYKYEGEE